MTLRFDADSAYDDEVSSPNSLTHLRRSSGSSESRL
jgi:hypothetical protein